MQSSHNDEFDIISHKSSNAIYGEWEKHTSAKAIDTDAQVHAYLRERYPELTITAIPLSNCQLVRYANLGYATAELDTKSDSVLRWRGYILPAHRGGQGQLGDAFFFAKYHYVWEGEDFILYTIGSALSQIQYILKEPGPNEDPLSHCAKSDTLVKTVVETLNGNAEEFVYVFDGYWTKSKELYDEVMKSSWDKVILDPKMKESLVDISSTFFDSKELYDRYGVPWKRGLIFAGPPGNGKTISIKALMKTLYTRKEPVPTLYVKNAPQTYHLGLVFRLARQMTPCLLVLEDIETIVTAATRSYFFNEVDGLTNNGGLLMVASTNYLDRLDPGLSKRPSRFDRKFIFPLPDEHERTLYARFWREKLEKATFDLPFPDKLCTAMANITGGFSFAYLQEAFIATLLILAREASGRLATGECNPMTDSDDGEDNGGDDDDDNDDDDNNDDDNDDDELEKYKLWRVFRDEVKVLRENMGSDQGSSASSAMPFSSSETQSVSFDPDNYRPESSFYSAAESNAAEFQRSNVSTNLPVRSTVPEPHNRRFNASSQEKPTYDLDSLEMAANGIQKREYFTQAAYEWRK